MLSRSVAGSWCAETTLKYNTELRYPTGLGGIGSVVGDQVAELVGGVHALALLDATQGLPPCPQACCPIHSMTKPRWYPPGRSTHCA